jgi:hypothetical protein
LGPMTIFTVSRLLKSRNGVRNNRLPSFHYILSISCDTDRIESIASNSSVACAFVAAGTCLPSRCLAILGGETENKVISLASFIFKNNERLEKENDSSQGER